MPYNNNETDEANSKLTMFCKSSDAMEKYVVLVDEGLKDHLRIAENRKQKKEGD